MKASQASLIGEATPLRGGAPPIPHHEQKVTHVELLTDLVFVVALKISADKLETDASFDPGVVIFMLRVFLFWVVWHHGAIIFNLSQRLDDDGILNFIDYASMLVLIALSIFMARAVAVNDDLEFILFYLCTRFVQVFYGMCRIICRRRPMHVSEGHFALAVGVMHAHNAMVLLAETLPLGAAIYLRALREDGGSIWDTILPAVNKHMHTTGGASGLLSTALFVTQEKVAHEPGVVRRVDDQPDASGNPPAIGIYLIATVLVLVWCFRLAGAIRTDIRHRMDDTFIPVLDVEHVIERYELIILIFLGEMVFAAATPGPWDLTLYTVVSLFTCFLLYFRARPYGGKLAWSISYLRNSCESLLHMLLFGCLGCLGAAWGLAIHNEHEKHELEELLEDLHLHQIKSSWHNHTGSDEGVSHPLSPGAGEEPAPSAPSAPHVVARMLDVMHSDHGVTTNAEEIEAKLVALREPTCFAVRLLIFSVAGFLVVTSISVLNNRDPVNPPPRLPNAVRFVMRAACGVGIACLDLLDCVHSLPMVSACVAATMTCFVGIDLFSVRGCGW